MSLRYVVVDDAPFIREILKAVMSDLGHVCVGEAEDGRAALTVVMRSLPDLIFLDLVMPRKNGLEARQELRDNWPEARIVACTTMQPEELPGAAAAGFDGFVTKPFDRAQIAEVVDRVMNTKKEVAP